MHENVADYECPSENCSTDKLKNNDDRKATSVMSTVKIVDT